MNRFGRHLSACEEQAAQLNGMTQPTRVVFVDYMADQQGPYRRSLIAAAPAIMC